MTRHVSSADAAVRRWVGILLVVAAMIAFVGVPTATGALVALALLGVAFVLFVSAHTESPFDRMFERRRRTH